MLLSMPVSSMFHVAMMTVRIGWGCPVDDALFSHVHAPTDEHLRLVRVIDPVRSVLVVPTVTDQVHHAPLVVIRGVGFDAWRNVFSRDHRTRVRLRVASPKPHRE
jgi:hypothetical protein